MAATQLCEVPASSAVASVAAPSEADVSGADGPSAAVSSAGARLPGRSRLALVDALNAEWKALESDRRAGGYRRAEVGRWAAEHPPLRSCHDGTDVLAAVGGNPDAVLAALIAVHQTGAHRQGRELAGRIVLQAMLGKLVAMARRDPRHSIEDYVGQLWSRIGSYPLSRRPRRIAANLALDTLKAVTRDRDGVVGGEAVALLPASEDQLERAGLAATAAGVRAGVEDLSAHRVLRTACELELIDDQTRRLLTSVYVEGLSGQQAARRFGISTATVRFRCSRAVRLLASYAQVIADAA